jgi:methylenetetrahydrofolate reductase (NADPH)
MKGGLHELTAPLQPGTAIYIAHPPRWLLDDVVRVAVKDPSARIPRVPAHRRPRATQRRAVARSADELHGAGIDQILLVAGDAATPAGPYASSLQVLGTRATVDCGITTVAVAGHPKGHKLISSEALWDALRDKQAFAERTGQTCRW